MNDNEKLAKIADSVEMEIDELTPDMLLADIENWDSVAVLSIIAVMNEEFNKFPSAEDIINCSTVRELMDMMQ